VSRLPWATDVPESWAVAPLKRVTKITLGKMLQSAPSGPGDVEAFYLRAANVQPDGLLMASEENLKKMWFSPSEIEELDLNAGDVVVVEGGIGGYGRSAILVRDLSGVHFQNSINRARPYPEIDGRFINYCLLTARQMRFIAAYCQSVAMPHLTAEKLAALRIPVPPARQQKEIADFLDRETGKIDTLIAKQDELVSALREHRSATIASSVIADREDVRLKYLTKSVRQGFSPQCESVAGDGITEWAVLKVGCVNHGVFRASENKLLPLDIEPRPDLAVQQGELVVSRANTRDLVGGAAVVNGDFPRLMLSDKTYALALDQNRIIPEFAALVLGTPKLRQLIEVEATGASHSMQNISQADILNLPIPLPPVDEQRQVLNHLSLKLAKVDRLIDRAEELTETMKTRRAALISTAATGQIDTVSYGQGV
jgi:type I restriction enzyme, S subunit